VVVGAVVVVDAVVVVELDVVVVDVATGALPGVIGASGWIADACRGSSLRTRSAPATAPAASRPATHGTAIHTNQERAADEARNPERRCRGRASSPSPSSGSPSPSSSPPLGIAAPPAAGP